VSQNSLLLKAISRCEQVEASRRRSETASCKPHLEKRQYLSRLKKPCACVDVCWETEWHGVDDGYQRALGVQGHGMGVD
jgi:hypothetical protein